MVVLNCGRTQCTYQRAVKLPSKLGIRKALVASRAALGCHLTQTSKKRLAKNKYYVTD